MVSVSRFPRHHPLMLLLGTCSSSHVNLGLAPLRVESVAEHQADTAGEGEAEQHDGEQFMRAVVAEMHLRSNASSSFTLHKTN